MSDKIELTQKQYEANVELLRYVDTIRYLMSNPEIKSTVDKVRDGDYVIVEEGAD